MQSLELNIFLNFFQIKFSSKNEKLKEIHWIAGNHGLPFYVIEMGLNIIILLLNFSSKIMTSWLYSLVWETKVTYA